MKKAESQNSKDKPTSVSGVKSVRFTQKEVKDIQKSYPSNELREAQSSANLFTVIKPPKN